LDAQAIGRSRGGLSSKLHLLTDALGQLIRVVLTAGQVHDATAAERLLDGQTADHVVADKAYDADRIRQTVKAIGADAVIPPNRSRAAAIPYDRHLYRERHGIECFIAKLKQFRRVATRYDKTAQSFKAFIVLAATIIGLR
jgi:transposase